MSKTLDYYHNRGWIDERQHHAGKVFAGDWQAASKGLRHKSMEPRVRNGAMFDMGGIEAARAHKAARELGHLRHVVITVCCLDQHASTWAKQAGEPEDQGIVLLRFGLGVLHRFYAVS